MQHYTSLEQYHEKRRIEDQFVKDILKGYGPLFDRNAHALPLSADGVEYSHINPKYLFINHQSIPGRYIKEAFISETTDKRIIVYTPKNDTIFIGRKNKKGEATGRCYLNFTKNRNILTEGYPTIRTEEGNIFPIDAPQANAPGFFTRIINTVRNIYSKEESELIDTEDQETPLLSLSSSKTSAPANNANNITIKNEIFDMDIDGLSEDISSIHFSRTNTSTPQQKMTQVIDKKKEPLKSVLSHC